MKRKRIIVISCFVLLLLVCIIPVLMYNYDYPNIGDDTASHYFVIQRLVNGTLPDFEFRYLGYAIIGYPLWAISQLFNIELFTLFNWFNILLPFFVGCALYFVFSRLINWVTGLLSLVILIFVAGASIYYLYYGLLFNMISVLILYPLLIYFVVKWVTQSKNYQLVLLVILTIITGTFHVSGLYLPAIFGLSMLSYLIYAKLKKKKVCKRKIVVSLIVITIGIVCIFVIPYTRQQIVDVLFGVHGGMAHPTELSRRMQEAYRTSLPIRYYVTTFITFSIIALLGIGIWKIKQINDILKTETKMFLCVLVCWLIVLFVITYSNLSTIPLRQQLDASIVIAMIATILVGVLIQYENRYLVIVSIIIIIGLYPQFVPTWFKDNSAVRLADIQATEYVKSLNIKYYDCSTTVSWAIYDVYLNARYKDGADILIIRNIDMTQGCSPDNPFYDGHGRNNDENYELLKSFEDGKVKVEVFKRMKQ